MVSESTSGDSIPIEEEPKTLNGQASALQLPLNVSDASDGTISSHDYHNRPGILRSYSSSRELSAFEPPNAAAIPYASLGYAPRQKSSITSTRPSQASLQAHSSLWKQQRQSISSNEGPSLNATFPSISSTPLAPLHSSPSTASTSTLAIEGLLPTQGGQKSTSSSKDKLGAAEALAKQQLRADLEALGVRVGSIGWALLDRLQSATSKEWKDLEPLLSSGKAVLLLPMAPLTGKEVTLSQAYNHVVFSTVPSEQPLIFTSSLKGKEKEEYSLLTLKGLRADLIDDTLQGNLQLEIKSFVPREDLGFVLELRDDDKRPGLLKSLMPLPFWDASAPSSKLRLLTYSPNLLLPPILARRRENSLHDNPRASSDGSLSPSHQEGTHRASGTFATLFGGRRERKSTLGEDGKELKDMAGAIEPMERHTKPDQFSANESLEVIQLTRSIAVAVIDREIRRAPMLDDVSRMMQERIRMRLQSDPANVPLPEDVVEVICSFAAIFFPPSSTNSAQGGARFFARSASTDTELSKSPGIAPMSAPFLSLPDELAESFQDFYSSIRDQLEEEQVENVDEQLSRVEEVVCEEVYDRVFCPFTSSDRFHDEALTLRIKALSAMNIGLSHLGLALPEEETERRYTLDGIEEIVTRCGSLLASLDDRRSHAPARKLDILVSAHKIIIDGLATLPKIGMIDEVEAREANINAKQSEEKSEVTPRKDLESRGVVADEIKSPSSGADLVLPLLLYCIIRLDPPRLASNLLYIQRFHAEMLLQGEASYCLVNVQAAVAFLENLVPASLGLTSSSNLVTAKHLEQETQMQNSDLKSEDFGRGMSSNTVSMPMRMRSKVAHDVGELAGMSNRVITGVLGSSMGAFGRMMGAGTTFAMRIEAEGSNSKGSAEESKQRGVNDVRSLLTGSGEAAVTNLGSALNKAVANEYEETNAKSITNNKSNVIRPRAISRTSSASSLSRPPTDYSRDRETSSPIISSTKARITDRLASIPTLNRTSTIVTQKMEMESPTTEVGNAIEPATIAFPHNGSTNLNAPALIPTSLQSPYPPVSSPPTSKRPLHVVLASTGSVASVKVPSIVESLLEYDNICIQILSTKASRHFFNVEALSNSAALVSDSSHEPYTVANLAEANADPEGKQHSSHTPRLHFWSDEDEWTQWTKIGDPILHIELRRWADIVLIAPCSANTLAKINAGICDDLLTSFLRALSPSTPTFLFPAMNTLMYMHPLTTQHLAFAKDVLNYKIVGPIEKRLACGDLGQGAMQEWSEIVDLVVQLYRLEKSKGESSEAKNGMTLKSPITE